MAMSYIGRSDLSRGLRNNNPGNLRVGDDWKGELGADPDGFIIFSDVSWGLRALARDLFTKYGRGLNTVREIITAYAPPSENDTAAYVNFVCDLVGVVPDQMLSYPYDLPRMMKAIIMRENGRDGGVISGADILEGISLAGNVTLSTAKEAAENPLVKIALLILLGLLGYRVLAKK